MPHPRRRQPASPFSAASTAGCTKPPTSPPRAAISRTRLDEMNVYPSSGREEHRLDARSELAVHARELKLVLEVRHRAQPSQDHVRPPEWWRSPPATHRTIRFRRSESRASPRAPALTRSSRPNRVAFPGTSRNRDDDAIETGRGSMNEIGVTIRNRVEGPGIDSDTLHQSPPCAEVPAPRRPVAAGEMISHSPGATGVANAPPESEGRFPM